MKFWIRFLLCAGFLGLLSSCQSTNLKNLTAKAVPFLKTNSEDAAAKIDDLAVSEIPIGKLLDKAVVEVNVDQGIRQSVRDSVGHDPEVLALESQYKASKISVDIATSQKDFTVSGSLYGGVEDVTDGTSGVALVVDARRLIYDGGQLDSQISSENLKSQSLFYSLQAKKNESALKSTQAWIELKRYVDLSALIGSRLGVLDPLITQLETVAEAGIGDVSQVAAAQRTVAMIRMTETDIEGKLEQARVNYKNIFGALPKNANFDEQTFGNKALLNNALSKDAEAPAVVAQHFKYKSALAQLAAIQARDQYSIGFESRVQRPFGGSSRDSDESLGVVARKTLYDGKKLESEIEYAKAQAEVQLKSMRATYRKVIGVLNSGQEKITSLKVAIKLARKNAANAKEEIDYLRQQLIIGQSTLDSVLSAEARLYEAESKEINFKAELTMARLEILASSGMLVDIFGL